MLARLLKDVWRGLWRRDEGPPISWSLATRLRLGAAYGVAMGSCIILVEAIFANWSSGRAFSRVHPIGIPFESVVITALVALPLGGMVATLLFPLYRTVRGAAVAGILSMLPFLLLVAPWRPSIGSILTVWDRLAMMLMLAILLATAAVGIRAQVIDDTAAEGRPPGPSP